MRNFRSVVALLLCLGAFAQSSWAFELVGSVVAIADGDTITVLDGDRVQHRVRLAGIDAPEKAQDFGERSRQNLARLVFQAQVVVEWNKCDRYDRIIGKVLRDGQDANLQQILDGMAWHYKQYAREQTPADQKAYAAAEIDARGAGRGLWKQPNAVPLWEWRRR